MAVYLNSGSDNFEESLNSPIYLDKSQLIERTNQLIGTRQKYVCISRPRRFGKTTGLEMLAAYYGKGKDASCLFNDLKVAKSPFYLKHLNQYDCVTINMQDILSEVKYKLSKEQLPEPSIVPHLIEHLTHGLVADFKECYPNAAYRNVESISQTCNDIFSYTKRKFVILIDEWDCLFREFKEDHQAQTDYLDFLRLWLKDKPYVGLAYMTGILPIKKYGIHSALNMFREFAITDPYPFEQDFGFTDSEVEKLCEIYDMNMEEMKAWYNGYFVDSDTSIYNPTSVLFSLFNKRFSSYWNKTETYEALQKYIRLNFDGLKDSIVQMLSGASFPINVDNFKNDMTTFHDRDDVLTLLVHLGYLNYNSEEKTVRIPNNEVKQEFRNAIRHLEWGGVNEALDLSAQLLKAVWNQEAEIVAEGIQRVHEKNTSILQYNDENALSYVLSLALFAANDYYWVIRELPTGKGFADLVFLPRKKYEDKPALVIELKWEKSATSAIEQIKERNYGEVLDNYVGDVLLVGINYHKKSKQHECQIEKIQKRQKSEV